MDGAFPEVCKRQIVACRRFFDDGRCPLGMCPNLLGHSGDGVGDRREFREEARLVSWWLEALFWRRVVAP